MAYDQELAIRVRSALAGDQALGVWVQRGLDHVNAHRRVAKRKGKSRARA